MKFRGRNELFNAVGAKNKAKVSITELALEYPALLLLDPTARLQSQPNNPLQVFIRDRHLGVGKQELGVGNKNVISLTNGCCKFGLALLAQRSDTRPVALDRHR